MIPICLFLWLLFWNAAVVINVKRTIERRRALRDLASKWGLRIRQRFHGRMWVSQSSISGSREMYVMYDGMFGGWHILDSGKIYRLPRSHIVSALMHVLPESTFASALQGSIDADYHSLTSIFASLGALCMTLVLMSH